jgi:hypothetical protein
MMEEDIQLRAVLTSEVGGSVETRIGNRLGFLGIAARLSNASCKASCQSHHRPSHRYVPVSH